MAERSPITVTKVARGILVARNGCSPDDALAALITAAEGNDLTVEEMAMCLVGHQDLSLAQPRGG
jgi:hypothetical protein